MQSFDGLICHGMFSDDISFVKSRSKSTPARPARKRRSPEEEGVAAAQRVLAKVLAKADPGAKSKKR